MLWGEFLVKVVTVLFVKSYTSTEFIEHIEFYIFQMVLLKIIIIECFHTDATLQLFDWFSITKEIWYFVYPLWLLNLFVLYGLLGLGIASSVYSHHLVAGWHILIPLIVEVIVVDWALIVFTVRSKVFHLHAFVWWSLAIIIHLAWVSYLFRAGAVIRTAKDYVLRGRRSLSWLVMVGLGSRNFSLLDVCSILFLTYRWILESLLIQPVNTLELYKLLRVFTYICPLRWLIQLWDRLLKCQCLIFPKIFWSW